MSQNRCLVNTSHFVCLFMSSPFAWNSSFEVSPSIILTHLGSLLMHNSIRSMIEIIYAFLELYRCVQRRLRIMEIGISWKWPRWSFQLCRKFVVESTKWYVNLWMCAGLSNPPLLIWNQSDLLTFLGIWHLRRRKSEWIWTGIGFQTNICWE